MNLQFYVRDRRITRRGIEPLTADAAGVTFTMDFDSEWTGLTKVVVFQNGDSSAQMLYTGEMEIPANVLGAGELVLACHGYRRLTDRVAVVRTVSMARPVQILPAEPAPVGDPARYTPTLFEQILALCGRAETAAAEARAAADDLRAAWARGDFTGPAGPAGPGATVAVDGAETGDAAAVYNLGTSRNARLRFVLPRGRGIAAIQDHFDGTWTISYTDGTRQTLCAPGVESAPGASVVAQAVAEYLAAHPPADGRGVARVDYADGVWQFTYTDGGSDAVSGPAVPTALAQLTGDSGHRTVTDQEKAAWNGKSDFSGDYGDLTGAPAVPALSDSVSSGSTATAATSSAVKQAYDLAAAAMPRSGGAFTGAVAAAVQTPGQALLRNESLQPQQTDPAADGEICWSYG